jgi:hypothetical protein
MRISIDTASDTFQDAIAAVHAAYGVPLTSVADIDDEPDFDTDGDADTQDDFFPGKWTRKRIRKMAEWVAPMDAVEALRYMALHAPAVDIDEVVAHMAKYTGIKDFSGQALGGRMASVGFAKNSINPSGSGIYDTDYKNRKYRMDKGIAKVLLEELDALEA